tara:strand:+ start:513 stop:671 length:159 start_codon:yes stop_codon:yes gene_type:complete
MENLKKFKKTELEQILKSVKEMIMIPIVNKFNLSREELEKMEKQLLTEIESR